MTASTRARVEGSTRLLPRTTRDTVLCETPAIRATSRNVGRPDEDIVAPLTRALTREPVTRKGVTEVALHRTYKPRSPLDSTANQPYHNILGELDDRSYQKCKYPAHRVSARYYAGRQHLGNTQRETGRGPV